MTSTSCEDLARMVLAECVAGRAPEHLPRELTEPLCNRALFGILAEGLGDQFDPALCDVYARLFARAIPGADAERYFRVRRPRPVTIEPRRVFVLSRITLGADIAVTSVLMDAAKQRFPKAQIVFVGPQKNFELFAGDPRLTHAPLSYRRDAFLDVWRELAALVDDLVIDPDSRLTQLGLLPVGDEERCHLFESRAYGGYGNSSLSELAARWSAETFGIPAPRAFLSPAPAAGEARGIAISLGVGQNQAKRLPDPFEPSLLLLLARRGVPIVMDRGAGGEERTRVEAAVANSGVRVDYWDGSFAGFAAIIANSTLYVGYDSAGQHAAAALGVPLVCIFAGFPSERMFHRWRPIAPNAHVIRVDDPDPAEVLLRVRRTLG